ncbi:MAG: tetratricopeptide repeat protein [Oligoflexia bacterium]|nr:tetratricopeptide repeat protein [Oligoflexia bacterium]
MISQFIRNLLAVLAFLLCMAPAHADVHDPFDPFDVPDQSQDEEVLDKDKSPEELLLEATVLLQDERLLDARTKILKALDKDPKSIEAHSLMAGYYLVHVGHYRLALKYIKRALDIFTEKNGSPPYKEYRYQAQHSHLLYLLSQIRLNLDDYEGSLKVLDEFTGWGYTAPWYSGTRAWVLMKLGNLDEAIRVARLGILVGDEAGRSLNMLGILLSMKGDRQGALKVFRDAIAEELSLGKLGQPATPLNNSGEVYKETFQEDKAESSWIRATSMPDGCEHVLPSLNLALLYIEEMNLNGARGAMDNFESCIAQYPLRNGEEHRALVDLIRGRVALHTGHLDEAIDRLGKALEYRQWFGKIGTDKEDLEAAALVSLSQALGAKANALGSTLPRSIAERLYLLKQRVQLSIKSWWMMRRARQVLIEKLNDLEDLYVRNTDSLLEYPTLGAVLSALPATLLEKRISAAENKEERPDSILYYQTFLAENYLQNGQTASGLGLLNDVTNKTRPKYDTLLRLHALLIASQNVSASSDEYIALVDQAFTLSRPSIRNYGLRLPVNFVAGDDEIIDALGKGPFQLDNRRDLQYSIDYERSPVDVSLHFFSSTPGVIDIKVRAADLIEAVNKLSEEVYSVDLK